MAWEDKTMANFTVNGQTYTAKAVDFNMVCDFEDMGLSFGDIERKTTSFIRGYLAKCGNMSVERAGKEIEAHIVNGGTLNDVASAMMEEVQKSDFFLALQKNKNEETTEKKQSKK